MQSTYFTSREICLRGNRALEKAINTSDATALIKMLSEGFDVNVPFENGISPLGRAIQIGNEKIIHLIMDAKSFMMKSYKDNSKGEAQENLQNQSTETMDFSFLKYNEPQASCASNFPKYQGLDLFNCLRQNQIYRDGCDINLPDFRDRTPLYYAVECQNAEITKELLLAGSKVNVSDNQNISPLHVAVCTGNLEICAMLLQAGSRVNGRSCDDSKSSALHMACSRGHMDIVKLLVLNGANLECGDSHDQTPIMIAVVRSQHAIIDYLLSKGAKINVEDIQGQTPLSLAVYTHDRFLVEKFLRSGAKTSNCKQSMLHYAVGNKLSKICELLLHHGALVNSLDENYMTPLRTAMKVKSYEIFHMLLAYGCSLTSMGHLEHEIAIHVLIEEMGYDKDNFSMFLDLLVKYGSDINRASSSIGDTPLCRSILEQKYRCSAELIRQGSDPNLGHVYSCPHNDNLVLAIQGKEFLLIKLMVYAGYRVTLFRFENCHILEDPLWKEIRDFLKQYKHNPLPLKYLARITIRKMLHDRIQAKVRLLPLPVSLKNFLIFEDIYSLM